MKRSPKVGETWIWRKQVSWRSQPRVRITGINKENVAYEYLDYSDKQEYEIKEFLKYFIIDSEYIWNEQIKEIVDEI